jgi:hypothetical protein
MRVSVGGHQLVFTIVNTVVPVEEFEKEKKESAMKEAAKREQEEEAKHAEVEVPLSS